MLAGAGRDAPCERVDVHLLHREQAGRGGAVPEAAQEHLAVWHGAVLLQRSDAALHLARPILNLPWAVLVAWQIGMMQRVLRVS